MRCSAYRQLQTGLRRYNSLAGSDWMLSDFLLAYYLLTTFIYRCSVVPLQRNNYLAILVRVYVRPREH